MLPRKIKREVDPASDGGTSYKRPEQLPEDENQDRLLRERLAGLHEMMDGDSADMELLDRTDRAEWPETVCVDTEPSILPK